VRPAYGLKRAVIAWLLWHASSKSTRPRSGGAFSVMIRTAATLPMTRRCDQPRPADRQQRVGALTEVPRGYEPTREAAMQAFARSWHRE
jgi:hypothetical protein